VIALSESGRILVGSRLRRSPSPGGDCRSSGIDSGWCKIEPNWPSGGNSRHRKWQAGKNALIDRTSIWWRGKRCLRRRGCSPTTWRIELHRHVRDDVLRVAVDGSGGRNVVSPISGVAGLYMIRWVDGWWCSSDMSTRQRLPRLYLHPQTVPKAMPLAAHLTDFTGVSP
jgi:hypothetical protein